ncbi:aminotransferase class I/II-fold pyridoxal phosphate-dependent enzyme [Porticoccus sp.]|uniref:aminotransferase class I/II-fold pyridoxal phosphate-dependent enzyme n=1 Tax=Porticoccus sp. TaxID=2024853 RepID=UPI003F69CEDE
MYVEQATRQQLQDWQEELFANHQRFMSSGLNLDLTRGKPSAAQLSLANVLDGILDGNYFSADGTDTRNYGGLDGLPAMRQLAADMLGVKAEEILVGGNSSLTLMYFSVLFAWQFGLSGPDSAWRHEGAIKFLCPVPGYDRHFAICEKFGIEMVNVPMNNDGPDMDVVEALIRNDPGIKGIWCVPKYSNPTGCIYSANTIERLAKLGSIAAPNFRVFYDNAYAVHDLKDSPAELANIMAFCEKQGTENSVLQFGSTSKITFAGAGVAFMAGSKANLNTMKKHLEIATIGPDKVNQLRHLKMIGNMTELRNHMARHAELLRPRFACALQHLEENFRDSDLGEWSPPDGGYFISFDTRPGLASAVIRLAAEAGVKLTPAGATFPYGKDPDDKNIRLAPSFPTVEDIDRAMAVFCNAVKLASVNQRLGA